MNEKLDFIFIWGGNERIQFEPSWKRFVLYSEFKNQWDTNRLKKNTYNLNNVQFKIKDNVLYRRFGDHTEQPQSWGNWQTPDVRDDPYYNARSWLTDNGDMTKTEKIGKLFVMYANPTFISYIIGGRKDLEAVSVIFEELHEKGTNIAEEIVAACEIISL